MTAVIPTMTWECSKQVLGELQKLLTCEICGELVSEPQVLGCCEHFFCSACIETNLPSVCPTCHIPSHVRDIQSNRQLSSAVQLCQELERLLLKPTASIGETPHPISEPTYTPKPPPRSIDRSVHDLVVSPTVTNGFLPCTPVVRCTRKAAARSRKRQAVEMSNVLWGTGGCVAADGHSHAKCTSCRKERHKGVSFDTAEPESEDTRQHACDPTESGEPIIHLNQSCRRTRKQTAAEKTSCDDSDSLRDSQKQTEGGLDLSNGNEIVDGSDFDSTTSTLLCTPHAIRHPRDKVQSLNDNLGLSKVSKMMPHGQIQSLIEDHTHSLGSSKVSKVAPHVQCTASLHPSPQTPAREAHDGQGWFSQLGQGLVTPMSTQGKMCFSGSNTSSPASVTKRNAKGETSLHVAAIKGDVATIERLLESEAAPNAKDHAGWTPLHEACNHGHLGVATVLLEWGAAINVPGFGNNTPLHDAVGNGRIECVRLLVSHGADVSARNSRGETSLALAVTPAIRDALCQTTVLDIQPCTLSQTSQSQGPHQVTLLVTSMTHEKRSIVQSCVFILHARIVDTFSQDVTHLVTSVNGAGTCARTLKYLLAILAGKWVVPLDWIHACIEDKSRAMEEPYEVAGSSTTPNSHAPRKARLNHEQQLPGLFDGCRFYLRGDFTHPTPSKDEIINLVKTGGGVILHREPKLDAIDDTIVIPYHARVDQQLANCSLYVIHDDVDAGPRMNGSRRCDAPVAWLLDCVANFRLLDPMDYVKKASS